MVKGRPPLIPRIIELEKRVTDLENAVLELAGLKVKSESKPDTYEPQFTNWPSPNGRT